LKTKGTGIKKIGEKILAELQQKKLSEQQQKRSSWRLADKGESK
jgi:hypothetical protein